jgi:hypothetical protein
MLCDDAGIVLGADSYRVWQHEAPYIVRRVVPIALAD